MTATKPFGYKRISIFASEYDDHHGLAVHSEIATHPKLTRAEKWVIENYFNTLSKAQKYGMFTRFCGQLTSAQRATRTRFFRRLLRIGSNEQYLTAAPDWVISELSTKGGS